MRKWIFAFAAVAALGACGKSIDVAEWTEEVKLSDGTMATVWRRASAYSGGFPNAKRGRDIEFELKYDAMGVHWKGTWNREPVSFDVVDGIPHLVLYIKDKESCAAKARGDYSAQFMRWESGQWIDVPQARFAVDKVLMNLYARYWGHTSNDDAKGQITWARKAERDGFNAQRPDTVKSYFERGQRFCSRFVN